MGSAVNPYAPKGLDPSVILPEVCDRMCKGELQEDIATQMGFTRANIWHWTAGPGAKPEHASMYARAKEIQAHALGEEAMRVARTATNDNAQGVRVHVDTIKWYTSKLAPKIYGEKIDISGTVEHTHRAVVINYGTAPDALSANTTAQPTAITSGLLSEVVPNDTPRSE